MDLSIINTMKKYSIILGLLIVCIALLAIVNTKAKPKVITRDYKNATYKIDGQLVTLVNGRAEEQTAPNSTSKTVTQIFGNEVMGDFNNDGVQDMAFIFTQTGGGSGTFYYVTVALGTPSGYSGTNSILLGDRIAPQTTEFRNGEIIVNYADRAPKDPMTVQPSIGVSKYLKIQGANLVVSRAVVGEGMRCGGNMTTAPLCTDGFHCAPVAGVRLPFGDVGGTCVAN